MRAPASRVPLVAAALLGGVTACASIIGLGDYEVSDATDAGADTSATDATPGHDAPPADTSPGPVVEAGADAPLPACSCLSGLPIGWTSVAFAESQTSDCPADLATVDLVTSPTGGSGSGPCTCGACKVTGVGCTANTWRALYNDNPVPNCTQTGVVHQISGGACVGDDGSLAGKFARVEAPAPSGGTCTADGVFNPVGVATTPLRSCVATPGGKRCPCEVANGSFAACIEALGDLACPDGFSKKHLGGTGVSGSCGACTCTPTNIKCTATASYFADDNCVTLLDTIDGDCKATAAGGQGLLYKSIRWAADASASCTTKAPASAETMTLIGPTTICCP